MKWIDCNLPWNYYDLTGGPKYPYKIINKKAKKEFGFGRSEAEEKLFPESIREQSYSITDKLRAKIDKMDLTDEEKENFYWEKVDASRNPIVKQMVEWFNFLDKYKEWEEKQSEIIEFEEADKKYKEQTALKSFCGRGLNKTGTLIELENGKQFLIGDINNSCGVCDDCVEFKDNTIIKRYAVIWEK